MEAQLKVTDKLFVKVEAEDQKNLWQQLAKLQEIFGENRCGKCGGVELRYVVRTVDENEYYELVCLNPKCRAKLSFGQHKGGKSLFPKRKNDDGYLADRGWQRWDAQKKEMV